MTTKGVTIFHEGRSQTRTTSSGQRGIHFQPMAYYNHMTAGFAYSLNGETTFDYVTSESFDPILLWRMVQVADKLRGPLPERIGETCRIIVQNFERGAIRKNDPTMSRIHPAKIAKIMRTPVPQKIQEVFIRLSLARHDMDLDSITRACASGLMAWGGDFSRMGVEHPDYARLRVEFTRKLLASVQSRVEGWKAFHAIHVLLDDLDEPLFNHTLLETVEKGIYQQDPNLAFGLSVLKALGRAGYFTEKYLAVAVAIMLENAGFSVDVNQLVDAIMTQEPIWEQMPTLYPQKKWGESIHQGSPIVTF